MEERIEKLERETSRLRHQALALHAALYAIAHRVPECRIAVQTAIEAVERTAPFQRIPDQELEEMIAYLRALLYPEAMPE